MMITKGSLGLWAVNRGVKQQSVKSFYCFVVCGWESESKYYEDPNQP
jgi:hypothetical protein